MDYDLFSLIAGTGTTLAIASPAEWAVHKYLLHGPRELRKRFSFVDNASKGHNDFHHRAYKGPAHYYRDGTNEKEVIHFSKTDIGVIAGVATFIGAGIAEVNSLIQHGALTVSERGIGYTLGAVAGAMIYYGAYESLHHQMHAIGERRQSVSRALGDSIQGGKEKRDGRLRLSKPLLDEIGEEIIAYADDSSRPSDFEPQRGLVSRLEAQLGHNGSLPQNNLPNLAVGPEKSREVLIDTARAIIERESGEPYVGRFGEIKKKIANKTLSILRNSKLFKAIDRHHFIHHFRYATNLNVVAPLADFGFGTKLDSSIKTLENEKSYWLCPNSPDRAPFKRAEAV